MIVLPSTSDIVRIVTAAATTLAVHASFVDNTTTTYVPSRQNTAISTATTTTVVSSPAASTQRHLKHLKITQTGGTPGTITIQHFDGTTSVQLGAALTLATGESIEFNDLDGWKVYDATGQLKQSAAASGGLLRVTLVTATASPFVLAGATRTVRVRLQGGGGQGGGSQGGATPNLGGVGSGGNSGGLVDFTGAQTGSFVYSIGAAGSGAAAGAAGTAGGNTTATVAGVALSATGGPGGTNGPANAATSGIATPAAAVTGSGVGAQLISGQRGSEGLRIQSGTAATTIVCIGGAGANSEQGAGGPAVQAAAAGAVAAGVAASGFGAGGSGGASGSAGASQAGGAGTGGWMLVEEYS